MERTAHIHNRQLRKRSGKRLGIQKQIGVDKTAGFRGKVRVLLDTRTPSGLFMERTVIIYIAAITAYIFIVTYPTLWAARRCGAQNATFLNCLIATIMAIAIAAFLILGIDSKPLIVFSSFIAMTISLKMFLGTKIFQSAIISMMSLGISAVIGLIAETMI